MKYRKLGRTGLAVSEICLGTMTFGGDGFWKVIGDLDVEEAGKLVRGAFDKGVNFIDTANVYSNGQSEQVLGETIRKLGLARDELVIATKVFGRFNPAPGDQSPRAQELARRAPNPNLAGLSRKHIFDSVDASLKRLGLDYIDLYQVHSFDPLTPLEETLDALDDVVRSGRVRYLGLCNYAAWQIAKAIGISERLNLARFESLQMYYSIAGRDLEREVVPLALDQHLAILPWSPLAGGFLSGKFTRSSTPNDTRRAAFDFPPVDKERAYDIIDVMKKIADARGVSVATVALAWVMQQPGITSTIIGAKNETQLAANLAAADLKLDAGDLKQLEEVSALKQEYPGWMLERQGAERRNAVA